MSSEAGATAVNKQDVGSESFRMNQSSRRLSLRIATFNECGNTPIIDRRGLIERSRDCAAFRRAIELFACQADAWRFFAHAP